MLPERKKQPPLMRATAAHCVDVRDPPLAGARHLPLQLTLTQHARRAQNAHFRRVTARLSLRVSHIPPGRAPPLRLQGIALAGVVARGGAERLA